MRLHSPEHLYQMHAEDVEAARQLSGLDAVGNADPTAKLSERAQGYLHRDDGNVTAATTRAKAEIGSGVANYSSFNAENLDRHIRQARQDMAEASKQKAA